MSGLGEGGGVAGRAGESEILQRGALVRTKTFGHRYQVLRVWRRRGGATLVVCRPIDVAAFHRGPFYFDPAHLEPVGAA